MSFNYNKLRGRIVEKYGTIDNFAQTLNVTRTTVSNKLNNKSGFTQHDMITWGDKLGIDPVDYGFYFFIVSSELQN